MVAVGMFVAMVAGVALVVVAVVYRKKCLHPKYVLPQHFEEVCMFICLHGFVCTGLSVMFNSSSYPVRSWCVWQATK